MALQDLNHKHIIVTATGLKNPPHSARIGEQWLIELVEKVEMKVLLGPYSVRCDDVGNEGVTGVVVISTSHASFHCWDTGCDPFIQMDLYSCKNFEASIVIEHIKEFSPALIQWLVIDRNLENREMAVIEHGHQLC